MPHQHHTSARLAWLVISAGALVTAGILTFASAPWESPNADLSGFVALVLWCVSPFAGLFGLLWLTRSPGQDWIVVVSASMAGGFGILVLADALVVNRSVLNALVTLAVPVVQWGFVLAAAAVVLLWRALPARISHRGSSRATGDGDEGG